MHYVSATNYWEQDPSDVTSDRELPFAHLIDRDDPAYAEIVQATVDLYFEFGAAAEVDDDAVKLAIRIGRARHARAQSDTPMQPGRGLAPWRTTGSEDTRGVVYYIRRGAMVKIGTTINLRQRMSDLRPEEVLAVEPGSYKREAEMHQRFVRLRVPGQREWFYAGREIQEHIEEVLDKNGPPPADLATLPAASGILDT